MKSIRTRITLTYLLLAVFVLAAAGIISSLELESYFTNRLIDDLERRAGLAFASLEGAGIESSEAVDARIRQLAAAGSMRLTLIDRTGMVFADSDVPSDRIAGMDNHLRRPEVQEAARKGVGADTRHSATMKVDFLYVAKKVLPSPSGALHDVRFMRASIHLEDLQAMNTKIRVKVLIAGIVVLLLVVGVSLLLSRRISKPIVEIASTVAEIRQGNLERHIPVRTRDEIGRVAEAVNELVDKLKADIVQLKKLEQARSEFLGNVSHELRTPLFSLQGFLETLLNGAIDDPKVNREFLAKAKTQADRLNALLGDLIDISQIESGDMKMSFRYFRLADFMNRVVEDATPLAERYSVKLILLENSLDAEVYGDKERLKHVMMNLLDNAIKYNRPNGEVRISCRRADAAVRISVSDTGSGIPAECIPRIFERFYRVDKERSRETGGTGLGLAIVKHIVEAHGRKVEVESAVGKGSTFSIELRTG
jgi:two-component system, OmpR family, phosphate regulon sensor histidine kinase PhoR